MGLVPDDPEDVTATGLQAFVGGEARRSRGRTEVLAQQLGPKRIVGGGAIELLFEASDAFPGLGRGTGGSRSEDLPGQQAGDRDYQRGKLHFFRVTLYSILTDYPAEREQRMLGYTLITP